VRTKWLLVLGLAATLLAAERRPLPWEKNRLRIGQALYRENCVVCHDIDKAQSKKVGPSFYQLFKRDKMPLASMKPNREYIKVRVKFGGPLMPAFRQWLTESEIDTVIDYIASK
jgi:mono/diheme cytochrome c family protein